MNLKQVTKRDGRKEDFNPSKIFLSVFNAAKIINGDIVLSKDIAHEISNKVLEQLSMCDAKTIRVDLIYEMIIQTLNEYDYYQISNVFHQYRLNRTKYRESESRLIQSIKEITFSKSTDSNLKRDNGNINGDAPMGMMLQYGSTVAKQFADDYLIREDVFNHVKEGDIYIHDKDFLPTGTLTCCHIPLDRLFKNGFDTGHGFLREPQSIRSYASLAAIAIQSNQNDQHGGQSIPLFDYYLAPGITKTLKKNFRTILELLFLATDEDMVKNIGKITDENLDKYKIENKEDLLNSIKSKLSVISQENEKRFLKIVNKAYEQAIVQTEKDTYQAMESFVHNLNTMHSRSGGQVPFSSVNFGMDTSEEGRMISRNLMLAQEAGLGNGETPIFPILIFQVKEGVNYNPEDKNYDLFKLSLRVSSKRMFPNYVFVDAPFNLQYYKPEDPETIIATMGCRTRVIGNINGKQTPVGRGNLSFTTINLPRLGIKYGYLLRKEGGTQSFDKKGFYQELDDLIDCCVQQLLDRYDIQKRKTVANFPFLMGQGNWTGSEKLASYEQLGDVIDSGSLAVGFIGLAECLIGLTGHHHGESSECQKLGLEIITHMRNKMDDATQRYHLNFSLLGTPAEGLSGFFTRLDIKKYGEISGITDKEYYTNSFHVPVSYNISFYNKILKEAPYHALTNGGHITYVEMDGDLSKNVEAFETIVRCMKEAGIGYGSINHPIDRDPICGYSGVIEGNICPNCGRDVTKKIILKKTINKKAQYKRVGGK